MTRNEEGDEVEEWSDMEGGEREASRHVPESGAEAQALMPVQTRGASRDSADPRARKRWA